MLKNVLKISCDMLGRILRSRILALHREEEVKVALIEEWDSLPQEMINGLIRSMGRRMTAVVSARGGKTRHYNKVTMFDTGFFLNSDIFEFLKCYFFSNRFHNCTNFVKQIPIAQLNFVLRGRIRQW
jgi:hypothetical protein